MPPSAEAAAESIDGCAARGFRCPLGSLFGRALIVVAIAGLIGVADSARRPIQLTLNPNVSVPVGAGQASPRAAAAPAADPHGDDSPPGVLGPYVDLLQAKAVYDSLEADFIDAREPAQFGPGHIPGAYNLTQADFTGRTTPEALEFLDRSRPVVIYCDGGDCHASENVAILLQQAGFSSIHIMTVGFPAWVEAGYEVESRPEDDATGGGR